MLGRLSPVWNGAATAAPTLKLTSPWVLYRDAGVIMEIADYASQNGRNVDHRLIAELRSDALQLRFTALKTFLMRAPLA
jgi:hypothetical protein